MHLEGVDAVRLLKREPGREQKEEARQGKAAPEAHRAEIGDAARRLAHAAAGHRPRGEPCVRLLQRGTAQQTIEWIGGRVERAVHIETNTRLPLKLRDMNLRRAGRRARSNTPAA